MSLCLGCMQEKGVQPSCPFCGLNEGDLKETDHAFLMPGSMLKDRYIVGVALGQGGFGITYIGYDQTLHTKVAIKEYYPGEIARRRVDNVTVAPFTQAAEDYQKGKERFLQEARTLAKFTDHPCIVGVKDCFDTNGTAYMVMEYLEGVDLKEYLNRSGGKVSVEASIALLNPVMDALRAVHQEGMIHRDISPDNIFITTDGRVRLIDFGAARQSMGGQKSLSIMLKPGYAPEEQYRSRGNQGPWTDVYALTATLYRMITGTVPPDSLERVMEDELEIPTELPQHIQSAMQLGMAIRAVERFSSVDQLQAALLGKTVPYTVQKKNQREGTVVQTPQEPGTVEPVRKANPWMLGLLSVIAVCIVMMTVVFAVAVMRDAKEETVQPTEMVAATNKPEATAATTKMPDPTRAPEPTRTPEPREDDPVDAELAPAPAGAEDYALLQDAVRACVEGYVYAVNTGDTSQMTEFIDSNAASFLAENQKMAKNNHDKGRRMEALDYAVVDAEWEDVATCILTHYSEIRSTNASGKSEVIRETIVSRVQKHQGRFLYQEQLSYHKED